MSQKFLSLNVQDVEAAMLLPFQVSVPAKETDLSRLTTQHRLNGGKHIVMIVSSNQTETTMNKMHANVRQILSAHVNNATTSIFGNAYQTYPLLAPTINACAPCNYTTCTLRQADYPSFDVLMHEVEKHLKKPLKSALDFVYVEADEKIINPNGTLNENAAPITQMVRKSAQSTQSLTVVTTASKGTNPNNSLVSLFVLAPLLQKMKEHFLSKVSSLPETTNSNKKALQEELARMERMRWMSLVQNQGRSL